ncbi:MAG TPA: M48 family metalloprotease [Candidatus Saccharimonadales bacterium]|nr:M48 family metalloprotease [Candidatus Saccharimonadales bacterium]
MYSDIAANKRKTVLIMVVFVLFVTLIIWIFDKFLGGGTGVFYGGLIGALLYVIFAYFSGAKMALAINQAKRIEKKDNPRLWRIVENLSITDGLPMPKVYIMNDPSPNAFATGRDPKHSAVCVTTGILDLMDDSELQGVLAHELSHIKNYDIRVMLVAFALTVIISLISDIIIRIVWFGGNDREENNQAFMFLGIVAAILAPIVATLIQLSVSRQREYLADASGALTTRYPEGLASALEKIKKTGSVARRQNTATAHLFFVNPLKNHSLANLFSTHPPIDDRIARLREMGTHA